MPAARALHSWPRKQELHQPRMLPVVRFRRSQSPPGVQDGSPTSAVEDRRYVRVGSHADVAKLAELIMDPGRDEPLIVLSSRAKERWPPLDVEDVRAIIGPSALTYFLETGPLSLDLGERLPDRHAPYNGSFRVWLPGVSSQGDRREHPSVFDPAGDYGTRSLKQLAYGLREAYFRRGIEPQVNPVRAYRSLQLVRVEDEAELRIRDLEEQLARTVEEREEATQRGRDESEEAVRCARKERDGALARERQSKRR